MQGTGTVPIVSAHFRVFYSIHSPNLTRRDATEEFRCVGLGEPATTPDNSWQKIVKRNGSRE